MFPNQRFGEVCWHNVHIFLHPLIYFMCHWIYYKLSALQARLSQENKLNATTQQLITAKIKDCALKQGSKTHSSMLQSNLQLQNEVALMSCRILAVKYRIGLPYVGFFPDMSGILVAKYASGRNVKKCFNVRDFGIMPFMKSNRNVFTVRITKC